jgi:hypothetical protein
MENIFKGFAHMTRAKMRGIMISMYQRYLSSTKDQLSKDIITKIIKAVRDDDDVLFYRLKGDLDIRESELRAQFKAKQTSPKPR